MAKKSKSKQKILPPLEKTLLPKERIFEGILLDIDQQGLAIFDYKSARKRAASLGADASAISPLVRDLQSCTGRTVSVSYFVSTTELSQEPLEDFLQYLYEGKLDASHWAHYSEITGFLYLDESLTVGGHNLLSRLYSYIGYFIRLQIVIHS